MTPLTLVFFGIVGVIIGVIIFFLCFDADDRFVETLVLAGCVAAVAFLIFLLLIGAASLWRFIQP